MSKNLKKYWNTTKKNLVPSLIFTGLIYLAGFILELIIVYGIAGGSHDTSVFPLASMMSLLSGIMIWIIVGPVTVNRSFPLAVSMSTTRKNYILMELSGTVFGSLILYVLWFLLFRLETGMLIPLCYSDFLKEPEAPFFTALFGSFSSGIFWALAFAGVALGIRLLFGGLLIRFGQIVYWVLWGIWMCTAMLFSRMDSTILAALEKNIYNAVLLFHGHFLPLLCCAVGIVISCIGVCLLKKQEVRAI